MLVINDSIYIQEDKNIFERSYDMRGAKRRAIEIRIPQQDDVDYDMLNQTFVDGVKIVKQTSTTRTEMQITKEATDTEPAEYEEIEIEEIVEYPLTSYVVAGDIIDKRDGSFVVYMGERTESEIKDEDLANLLLMVGGIE